MPVVINIPAGTRIALSSPLLIDGIYVTIRSTGSGATLDGASSRRLVHVASGGHLALENIHLENGHVTDDSGGCALVEGAHSVLLVTGT